MAYQRKPKRTSKESAKDSFEFADEEVPLQETPRSAFMSDFQNMHPSLNTQTGSGDKVEKNAMVGKTSIESIVSTLAHLQFTTKGRIDENGKFELIFCSPEPVVAEVSRLMPRHRETVKFIEDDSRSSYGHTRKRSGHKRKSIPWLLT